MGLLTGLNWLDALLFIAVLIGLGIGYAQGMLRQMIGLLALYIGAILGAQYYVVISALVRWAFPDAPSRFTNALGFFFILIAVTSIVNWLVMDTYRSTRLQLFPLLDHIGGSILGIITTVVMLSLLVPVLTFATVEPWPWAESVRFMVALGLDTSRLLPVFDLVKPGLMNAIGPWMPNGLPSIFNL